MPSYFVLRMQFGLHQDTKEIARRLLTLVKNARVDEIMVFFFAEELNDGHETLDRIKEWIEHSKPYREALVKAGIQVSLNPWHSVLHCDRGRKLKQCQNWQRMVDQNGRMCDAVVCPLDKAWQRYYEEALQLYSKEGFRVIWIDDDIRLQNHLPLDWGGCFCETHVAEFNKRAHVTATREEIVEKCTATGEPHPWRQIWMDMWQDTYLDMISRWRKIVEGGGSKLGLMSSLPESHAAEGRNWQRWWKACAGNKPPIHRPHFWSYSETMGSSLPNCIAVLDQNRSVQPVQVENGPEIECFPYGSWNKSFRQISAQMALAHILGSTHLNISLYDFMGNRSDCEPDKSEFLSKWRPTMDWLADTFSMDFRTIGVGVPWSEDIGRQIHAEVGGKWQSLECSGRGWANWLGAAGIAFSVHPSESVNALAGPIAWCFSDSQLRSWLSKGLILDGFAAKILVERGMGNLIGIQKARFINQSEILYSVEQCLDSQFSYHVGCQISVNDKCYAARLLQADIDERAYVISDLRSPTQKIVGHGLLLFENELGGRIAIFPGMTDAKVEMNIYRSVQLKNLVRHLDTKQTCGFVEGGAWLVPQFLYNGKSWRAVVWNASSDETNMFSISLPKGMPQPDTVVQVSGGQRYPTTLKGNIVCLERPLYQWEFVVMY